MPLGRFVLRAQLREVSVLDEFHAEKMRSVVLARFVDRHDVRMIQPRRRFRLAAKPLHLSH